MIIFALKVIFLPKKKLGKPDSIIVSSMPIFPIFSGWLLKLRHRCQLIFEIRDLWPLTPIHLMNLSKYHPMILFIGRLEKLGYRKSDYIVSLLPNSASYINAISKKPEKFQWIPNGISEELMTKEALSDDILKLMHKDKFIIGYTGAMGIANALDYFIDAAQLLIENKDIHFVLVGDGYKKEDLQEDSRHLENVTFIPKIKKNQVHEMLKQHPEINVSISKEPHYFITNKDKSLEWYQNNWDINREGLKGDFSTTYLYSTDAQNQIKKAYPTIKAFIILRSPLVRSLSHFRHLLRRDTPENYKKYIEEIHPEIISNSLYADRISQAYKIFGRNQVKILCFDDISQQPLDFLQEAFDFLEVSTSFVPENYAQVIGKGYDSSNKFYEQIRKTIQSSLEKMGLHRLIQTIKNTGVTQIGKNQTNETLQTELEEGINRYQSDFIKDLEKTLILDLSKHIQQAIHQWLAELKKD